jgi:hypothetical protein
LKGTYVTDVLVCVSALAGHHDYCSLDVGWPDPLAIAAERVVVDEREVVVRARRVANFEVSDLRATALR